MHAMMYRFSSVVGPKITRPSQLAARYQFFLDVVTGILGESNAVFHEPARDPVSSLWQLFGSPDPIRRSDLNIWLMSWAASFASRVGSLPVDKTRQGPEWPVMMRFQGEHSLQLASEGEFPRFWLKLGEPDAFASDVEGRRGRLTELIGWFYSNGCFRVELAGTDSMPLHGVQAARTAARANSHDLSVWCFHPPTID